MSLVQEVRVIALDGLRVPEGTKEGTRLKVACEVVVSSIDQEWIDVTTIAGKPEQLPGSVTLGCVATSWTAG